MVMRAQHSRRVPTFQQPLNLETPLPNGSGEANGAKRARGPGSSAYSGLDPKEAVHDPEILKYWRTSWGRTLALFLA
jgi:hypothetical protein